MTSVRPLGFPGLGGPGRASSSEPTINTLLRKDPWLLPPETRPEWGYEKKKTGENPPSLPFGAAGAKFLAELLLEDWITKLWKWVFGMETQTHS